MEAIGSSVARAKFHIELLHLFKTKIPLKFIDFKLEPELHKPLIRYNLFTEQSYLLFC